MQKAQKLVIKSISILLLFYFQTISSQQNDIINLYELSIKEFEHKDSILCYFKSRDFRNLKSKLKDYYDFRTKKRPFYTYFAIDSISGKEYIDSIQNKQNIIFWKKKYSALDGLFSTYEIKQLIDNEQFDSINIAFDNNQLSVEWCEDCICINRLSKPFFNTIKNVALLFQAQYYNGRYQILTYIYRKSNENWILYSKINSFGW